MKVKPILQATVPNLAPLFSLKPRLLILHHLISSAIYLTPRQILPGIYHDATALTPLYTLLRRLARRGSH
jgi:hypothetical protein